MPIDPGAQSGIDVGLLSPVSAGTDAIVSDHEIVKAILDAEIALVGAFLSLDAIPEATAAGILDAAERLHLDPAEIAREAVSHGNPIIPIIKRLRAEVAGVPDGAIWVHHGVTSQDMIDTALAMVGYRAVQQAATDLDRTIRALAGLAERYRDLPAAARTLTQHAVPTTVGARFADWVLQLADARDELLRTTMPIQLGGAAGTLAALVEELGLDVASRLPAAFAQACGVPTIDSPWHTRRTAVTRLGDSITRVTDALGRIGADVATLARTEIGELAEGSGGGSSAMPQKQNPVRAVLLRSASLQAPQLAATLHLAAASAVDERPDGAWHAEWPALRGLFRLLLGAASRAAELAEGLQVDEAAVARNLSRGGGTIMAERIMLSLGPFIGPEVVQGFIDRAAAGEDLMELFRNEPAMLGFDVAPILDPSGYLGFTGAIVDRAVARAGNLS